jgi:hypothetical protein
MQGHEGSQVMAVLGAFKSERTLRTCGIGIEDCETGEYIEPVIVTVNVPTALNPTVTPTTTSTPVHTPIIDPLSIPYLPYYIPTITPSPMPK